MSVYRSISEESGDSDRMAYVLAIDIGTTSVRCHIYNRHTDIKGTGSRQLQVLHPQQGFAEIDPDTLWRQIQVVCKEAVADAGLTFHDITCIGIATQRNTFITWDKETGEPFHKFITWQDLRASDYVKRWNESYLMKAFNAGSKVLYTFTRMKRFLAGSVLRFKTQAVPLRLLWMLQNNTELMNRAKQNQVCFAMIETWLLWKLTKGKVYATDYSCASGTGMFDPFQVCWSGIVCGLTGIPMSILPPVQDTSGYFGDCSAEIFGVEIPITAIVADQQSAMFGQCCFNVGDVKCTMGTGTFIDLNTGNKPHASMAGLYPMIGWKIGSELVYIAEGNSADTGLCIEWAKRMGLFKEVQEIAAIAASVQDSDGVYFVPAFSGLQAPINDDYACAALFGLNPNTSKAHILRSILESLAFRMKILHDTMLRETKIPINNMRCDGGVCNNEFLMQLISDLIHAEIDRPQHMDMTSLGAAFLAGLGAGIWKTRRELIDNRKTDIVFRPVEKSSEKYTTVLQEWQQAVKRSKSWYS